MPVRLPASSQADLLPLDDPQWDWKQFERFCFGFVTAQSDVKDAHLYGTRGQDQKGIDIEAELADGRTRTYQCRKWQTYTESDVKKTVKETEKQADEHVILVTCEVGTKVRDYIDALDSWRLLDKEDLSRAVREIEPRERARRLVEDTFTVHWRRAFLGPAGPLAFWETDDYFEWALDEGRLFRHTWDLVGRADLVRAITQQLDSGKTRVLLLPGRGGIGKTRVLRAVADELKARRTIFFADDEVPLSAEAVEELPWSAPIVFVDDAHRRDDLAPLISAARRRAEPVTVVLATRPQRLDELRVLLSRAGFEPDELWAADAMGDLPQGDVESLARQALGDEHAHHAGRLAEATADCPLVTVIGGQLLAARAVAPELLERQEDFRATVLDRFRDEMLGKLSDDVDQDQARETLVLLAALGPVSVEDQPTLQQMAGDLSLDEATLKSLVSQLEEAGVVIARGRLRRIVPDVLADHILHRACVDRQGRPTGRSDALLNRYGTLTLPCLLRNLAELDWRIGVTEGDSALLADFWQRLQRTALRGDAEQRLRIIEFVRPVAMLAAGATFELASTALANPADSVADEMFGYQVTDDDVRRALPRLLGSAALTHAYLADAISLLWQLGRDDDRPLHQHPDHALRILEEIADYQLPLAYPEAVLALAEQLLGDEIERDQRVHSPLQLLRPLLAREGTTVQSVGLALQFGSYSVNAQGTAVLRGRVREQLVNQATRGSLRSRVLSAEMLGDALRQPIGYFGRPVAPEALDQWHEDQMAILDAIERVITGTDDPHVRSELRDSLEWHAEHSVWEDVRDRARALHDYPLTEREQLVAAIRNPVDWQDQEGSEQRLREFAEALAAGADNPEQLADKLDKEVAELEDLPKRTTANPAGLLVKLSEVAPELGMRLSEWCVASPDRALSRLGGDSLLAAAGARSPEDVRGLLETLRAGDVPARRQLAGYLSTGTWFETLDGPEPGMLRALVADDDAWVVKVSLMTVLRLAQHHPELAIDTALQAHIGASSQLADDLCMAINRVTGKLTEEQVAALLAKLGPVDRLEYWANDVLGKLAPEHREAVLAFLLGRAAAGGDVRALSFHDYGVDLLGGAQGEELLVLLRRVRDAMLGADWQLQWELKSLYWQLTPELQAKLTVLLEWLAGDVQERIDAALELLADLPWDTALVVPDFVEQVLTAAHSRDTESLEKVMGVLVSATVMAGDHSRTLGQPTARDERLRQEAAELAKRFGAGSPARLFYENVGAQADRNINAAALEDEEFPERR